MNVGTSDCFPLCAALLNFWAVLTGNLTIKRQVEPTCTLHTNTRLHLVGLMPRWFYFLKALYISRAGMRRPVDMEEGARLVHQKNVIGAL